MILGVPEFNFQRFMASETQMLTWKAEGLPADDLSVQNAIAIKNSIISPLVVDPSFQVRWISRQLKKPSLNSLLQL